jgi:hypothetical protein
VHIFSLFHIRPSLQLLSIFIMVLYYAVKKNLQRTFVASVNVCDTFSVVVFPQNMQGIFLLCFILALHFSFCPMSTDSLRINNAISQFNHSK